MKSELKQLLGMVRVGIAMSKALDKHARAVDRVAGKLARKAEKKAGEPTSWTAEFWQDLNTDLCDVASPAADRTTGDWKDAASHLRAVVGSFDRDLAVAVKKEGAEGKAFTKAGLNRDGSVAGPDSGEELRKDA